MTDASQADDVGVPPQRYHWLQAQLFPRIIAYTIHPLHIVALLGLWIGLLVLHDTLFELVGGNYTNGLSAMAASIVLLQQTRLRHETRRLHHQHHELLTEVRDLVRSRPAPRPE
jgi:hypothetical protein